MALKSAAILSDKPRTLRAGLLVGALDQALVSGATFAASVIIGRLAGAEELGVYAFAASLAYFAIGIQDSAISSSYVIHSKRMKADDRKAYAGATLIQSATLVCMLTVIGVCLLLAGLAFESLAKMRTPALILLMFGPSALLRQFGRKLAFTNGRSERALLVDSIAAAMQLAGLTVLVSQSNLNAISAAAVAGVSFLVAFMVWIVAARSEYDIRWGQWSTDLKRTLSQGKWIVACRMVSLTQRHAALWLLTALAATESVGVFAACLSVVSASNVFIFGLANVLEPRLAEAYGEGGVPAVRSLNQRITCGMLLLLGAFVLGIYLFGADLVSWLYSAKAYHGQTLVVTLLALSVWVDAMAMATSQALRVLHRSQLNLTANTIAAVVCLALAAALIPLYGITGAAICMLGGSITAAVVRIWAYRREVGGAA